jgi:imidazolonepropionase
MDLVLKNISLLGIPQQDHIIRKNNIHIGVASGRISYIGPDCPQGKNTIDATGLIALPGLVDPHTHAIWGGSRANEFARRLSGTPYTQILEEGGGILSTVRETSKASEKELLHRAKERINAMHGLGVTQIEVKSGYGLNPEIEHKMLRVAGMISSDHRITPTFLGAHTIPLRYRNHRSAYVREIIEEQLPLCAPHAEFIDVYCDRGAFTLDESIAILEAGKKHGLKIKAHAEQVTHTGIAEAAANMGACSVEHLEYAKDSDIAAMKDNGTVAVLLPGAQLYLKDRSPPVEALREAGVPIAIGTDLNPGSSPVFNIWTCATLSCLIQGLTMEEAILGMTIHAGKAIDHPYAGRLELGGPADIALFRSPPGDPIALESLLQSMGYPCCVCTIKGGKIIHSTLAKQYK